VEKNKGDKGNGWMGKEEGEEWITKTECSRMHARLDLMTSWSD
jgi:hypothetical protein